MYDFLGLHDIRQTGPIVETPDLIEVPAELTFDAPPRCNICDKQMVGNGTERVRVWDAPTRGKRVILDLAKERRRCRACKIQRTASSEELRPGYRVLTHRLVRYVENRVIKTTMEDVARETGLTSDLIQQLALDLDKRLRLQPSHWDTPAAVAVDNIQTAPNSRFQVLFDQLKNRPMAIAPTWSLEPILQEVHRHLQVERVRVFSSDMSDVNLHLASEFTNAIHVADKFHVFDTVSDAVSTIVRTRVNALVEAGDESAAVRLRLARSNLLGQQQRGAGSYQVGFELEPLTEELARYGDIAAVHEVRCQLIRFYASTGLSEARLHLNDLHARMLEPSIASTMKRARNYIKNHDVQIFGYFEALELMGRDLWSPTTSALEQRNDSLQRIWRSSRGGLSLPLFRLRGIYQPYTLGLHLVDCAGCLGFVGPLNAAETLSRSQSENPQPLICPGCQGKRRATPDSVESDASSSEYGVAA